MQVSGNDTSSNPVSFISANTILNSSRSHRWCATQQPFGAQILVDIRPMNAIPATTFFPMGALVGCRIKEPWIPSQRGGDGTAIHQIDDQAVLVTAHIKDSLVGDLNRNIHATSPETSSAARQPKPICTNLVRAKAPTLGNLSRFQPNLDRRVTFVDMDMRRFDRFVAVEIEAETSEAEKCWHFTPATPASAHRGTPSAPRPPFPPVRQSPSG